MLPGRKSPVSPPVAIRRGFLLALVAVLAFRAWFAGTLPLSGDESYHWEWSRHLAFGYYDHPGLTAYLIRLFTTLAGASTEASVRMAAVAMLGFASLAGYALARAIARDEGAGPVQAEQAGAVAGGLLLTVPVYAGLGVYISTDPPLIAAWTGALWAFYMAFHRGTWGWWLAAGALLGLAMLSKFLAFFMVPGLVLFVLLNRGMRKWILRPHPYVAGLVALAFFSPFLWWNATHGWATFMFNFVYRQKPHGFSPVYGPELVLSQAVALSPGVFVLACWGLARAAAQGRRAGRSAGMFLSLTTAVPLSYLLWVSLRQRIGLHWPAAAWVGMMVFLSVESVRIWPALDRAGRAWFSGAAWVCAVMTVAIHAVLHVPPGWLRMEWAYKGDPKRFNSGMHSERFGWRELGCAVKRVRDGMLREQGVKGKGVFIITPEYGLCSNVSFYTPGQPPSHLWSRSKTHGENYRFWDDYPAMAGQDALFVATREDRARRFVFSLARHFERVGEPEPVPVVMDGEVVRTFWLVRATGFDGLAPSFEPGGRESRQRPGGI
ncbi:MAG: glycosyltransferase family 39 protein [Lentisphaerae bacterium]|nr:glycosyltransferase family 39 protein [Lentisphaerota bacterium]